MRTPYQRDKGQRERLRRLRARIDSDLAHLRPHPPLSNVVDQLEAGLAAIQSYLDFSGPTQRDRRKATLQ